MLTLHSRVPLLRGTPRVLALSLALSFVGSACDEFSDPTSSEAPTSSGAPMSFNLTEQAILDLVMTTDDPRAAQLQPLQLSENGADLYGVGGGQSNLGTQSFDLSAHTGPRGDFGHWGVKVDNPTTGQQIVRYRVDVTCVNIFSPTRGLARGVVEKVDPVPNVLGVTPGETLFLLFDDGGEPSSGPLDDFHPLTVNPFPELSCKLLSWIGDANNVTQGNIRVKMN